MENIAKSFLQQASTHTHRIQTIPPFILTPRASLLGEADIVHQFGVLCFAAQCVIWEESILA